MGAKVRYLHKDGTWYSFNPYDDSKDETYLSEIFKDHIASGIVKEWFFMSNNEDNDC